MKCSNKFQNDRKITLNVGMWYLQSLLGKWYTKNGTDAPYLYNPYLFTAYLALYLKKYDMAMHYLEIYNKKGEK